MTLLVVLVLLLLILTYLQSREIRKLKGMITFDEAALIIEAGSLLKTNDKVAVIKRLRQNHYPLGLVQAKKIVDQAEGK